MKTLHVAAGAVLVAVLASGCVLRELWQTRRSEQILSQYAYVEGTVASESVGEPWMVVLLMRVPCDDDWRAFLAARDRGDLHAPPAEWSEDVRALQERLRDKLEIASHVVLQRPGRWYDRVAPGCYAVGAFEDLNRNYRYDDEPAATVLADPDRLFELRAGDRREGLDIVIPPEGRFLAAPFGIPRRRLDAFAARSPDEQLLVSLEEVAVQGEIADLSDPRFGAENGRLGYFDIYSFAWKVHPGIYFAEPYDPRKIPVLFIHGATGHPSEFATLAGGLDRTRYQPWFFFYPSGAALDGMSDFLQQQVAKLQLRLGFSRLAVVAHSMGGLVARAFVLRHDERMADDPVRVFVAISTPWGGMASAQKGAENSPIVVPSWRDIATDSAFLEELFYTDYPSMHVRRRLPPEISFYLVFGVDDTTIRLSSAVRWEAIRDAKERWPLAYDHTRILQSSELATLLREILKRELD